MKREKLTKTSMMVLNRKTLWSSWFIQNCLTALRVNPCPAELFVSIFHSFEAGITNAISSFK